MVKRNPTKAERRRALVRAANILSNYVIAADSGVRKGYYTQNDFSKMYKMVEDLDRIAAKMK